jgi:hypothetical protein
MVRFDFRQVSQFVLGQLLEKQKEMKTSKAHLRAIDQFCIINSDPKNLILEQQLVEFLTQMGIQARPQQALNPNRNQLLFNFN